MSKTRGLTGAQYTRRRAILDRLRKVEVATPAELRQYLAHFVRIFVTVDTVGRDLRAMENAGTLVQGPHPKAGHTWGGGRRIAHTGWRLNPDRLCSACGYLSSDHVGRGECP